ncbi:MAG: B-box zinc finger protein [Anaerolineales bacterium]|nr:B-box zinc finger protein [Anaerolineales bacterium]
MAAEACYRHPARPAVEHCEQCRQPVCGSCLWYAEAGVRLCPDHAAEALQQGQTVVPPERYAGGIAHSEAWAARPARPAQPYAGNSTDVSALVAALAGIMALLSCVGLSWVIPFLALALGLVAWLQARDAADPGRTRLLASLGLAGGGIFALLLIGLGLVMMLCMLSAVFGSLSAWPRGVATPIPVPTSIP